jgi:DNA replication protein DnaC
VNVADPLLKCVGENFIGKLPGQLLFLGGSGKTHLIQGFAHKNLLEYSKIVLPGNGA